MVSKKHVKIWLMIILLIMLFIIVQYLIPSIIFWQNDSVSSFIEKELIDNDTKVLDMAQVEMTSWDTLCVLGPYSTNEVAASIGINEDIQALTGIDYLDTIAVLVFVNNKDVVAYTKHPRNMGDFAELSGQCFSNENAVFVGVKGKDGWLKVEHKK